MSVSPEEYRKLEARVAANSRKRLVPSAPVGNAQPPAPPLEPMEIAPPDPAVMKSINQAMRLSLTTDPVYDEAIKKILEANPNYGATVPELPRVFRSEELQFFYEQAVAQGTMQRLEGGSVAALELLLNYSSGVDCATGGSMSRHVIFTEPMGAPRMTRSDKWRTPRRDCVQRYFDYRDKLRTVVGDVPVVPDHMQCTFFISMPDSWSKKKKAAMVGKPHRQRPDRDNLDKAVMDALFLEDGGVWSGSQKKFWCKKGEERVEISMRFDKVSPP